MTSQTAATSQATIDILHGVLRTEAIEPMFQPVLRLSDGAVIAYEALARFHKDTCLNPDIAFAAANEAGLGVELELLAMRRALAALDEVPAGAYLSTNLSVEAILDPRVQEILLAHAHRRIAVELTEHTQVFDYPGLVAVTEQLRAYGIRIAVDDAGAGFASLSHILQLRPDIIKLDITLTSGIDMDPVRMALARCLAGFASDIGAMLVAEGIETEAEREKLQELGIRLGQGYLLGRPAPLPKQGRTV
ncbi:EAL domain-containing protein [Actinoplanes sichuanensis]|uniref:EAL domain-containing protein n=1 Tax=Actinoplanes sichuanensis TaxID=512349 RepID=A0ABW3ZZT3_9ACTN|nr:EAL domain-containing protein [Actinoplanes sichuanensis]